MSRETGQRVVLVSLALLTGLACGGSVVVGSCTQMTSTGTTCTNYIGSGYNANGIAALCNGSADAGLSSTFAVSACAAGTNGSCDLGAGTSAEQKVTSSGGAGPAAFQSKCVAAGGTYSP